MSAVATNAMLDVSAAKLGAVSVGQQTAARVAGLLYLLTLWLLFKGLKAPLPGTGRGELKPQVR